MKGNAALQMEKLYAHTSKAKPDIDELTDFDPEEPITWSCTEIDSEEITDDNEQLSLDIESPF